MFDAHAHLQLVDDFPSAEDKDFCGRGDGPSAGIITCGTSPEDWDGVFEAARRFSFVYPFYGVHPWFIDRLEEGWERRLGSLLAADENVGVGEIGLDKLKDGTRGRRGVAMDLQRKVFRMQLELAIEYGRPASIHCVHAWGPLFEDLEAVFSGHGGDVDGGSGRHRESAIMLHAFGGSYESAMRVIDLGGYISFAPFNLGGPEGKTADVLRRLPADRILLDSDFPLKAGQSITEYAGVLADLSRRAAQIRGVSCERLIETVSENGSVFAE